MDRFIAVGLMLFSAIYLYGAWKLPRFSMTMAVDAYVFPIAVGLVMLALSALLFFQSTGEGRPRLFQNLSPAGRTMAILVGWALAYALLIRPLGYLLMTTLFIVGASTLLGWRRWGVALGVALAFAGASYYLFTVVLSVTLPSGILAF